MIVEINLTQLDLVRLEELSQIINESIDYNIETEEMQMNYEASQNIEHYINKH